MCLEEGYMVLWDWNSYEGVVGIPMGILSPSWPVRGQTTMQGGRQLPNGCRLIAWCQVDRLRALCHLSVYFSQS